MTTPPITSGRADTAMTDPRIALAAQDCADELILICEAAQRMAKRTGNTFVLDRQRVSSMIAGRFSALRAIQPETGVRERTVEECAKVCDAAAKASSEVVSYQTSMSLKHRAEGMSHGAKLAAIAIRALSASKPGAVASAPVHPAPGVITMSDVRLIAGEGKLSASTVLQACNVIMKQRSALPLTDQVVPKETDFYSLHEANVARQKEWDPDNRITLAYRGNELAGEVGEACNVIKKLERERLGINGSRDTVEHLMEELADGVICSYLVAMQVDGNLDSAIVKKFNATSEKMGLRTRMLAAAPVRGRTG